MTNVEGVFAAGDGKEGRAGSCGDEVFVVDEDGFFAAFAVGFNPCEDVGQQVEGFDVAAFPSQVGVSADAHAGQFFLGVVPQFLDGEEERGVEGGSGEMVAELAAAGEVEIDFGDWKAGLAEGVEDTIAYLGDIEWGKSDFVGTFFESG